MTRRNKAQRYLKTDARMTPYDVKVKGTFAEPPKKVKLPPRKPTSEEQRANNIAPVEFSRESASVGNWIPLFRKELAENFDHVCGRLGTRFVTSIKVNTKPVNGGSRYRGEATRLWCSMPYAEWVEKSGYGRRWKSECGFSNVKRLFGESIHAFTMKGAVRKLLMKTETFSRYKEQRAILLNGCLASS